MNEEVRVKAAGIISQGGVIAFRTDTFYGLGADPLNSSAVRRILNLKGREDGKPILLLVSDLADVDRFIIRQSSTFRKVAHQFWPGPLTLVGEARQELPEELTAGTGTIGVRLASGEDVRALVRACGGALTATSANLSGQLPARSAEEVKNHFPIGVDLIIDGGEVAVADASTVLDLSGNEARLVREGAIKREQLVAFLLAMQNRER